MPARGRHPSGDELMEEVVQVVKEVRKEWRESAVVDSSVLISAFLRPA